MGRWKNGVWWRDYPTEKHPCDITDEGESNSRFVLAMIIATIICIVVMVVTSYCSGDGPVARALHKKQIVTRVIDGDTIILGGGERVRLLGINAPELRSESPLERCRGWLSKDFLAAIIEGEKVTLTYEGKRTDHYGRTLAWVWFEKGKPKLGLLFSVNSFVVRHGYSRCYPKYPTSKTDELCKLEENARLHKLGMFEDGICDDHNIEEDQEQVE